MKKKLVILTGAGVSAESKIDAMLALYSCRRAGRLHNNHNRHEVRVYEYKGKFYLTSKKNYA